MDAVNSKAGITVINLDHATWFQATILLSNCALTSLFLHIINALMTIVFPCLHRDCDLPSNTVHKKSLSCENAEKPNFWLWPLAKNFPFILVQHNKLIHVAYLWFNVHRAHVFSFTVNLDYYVCQSFWSVTTIGKTDSSIPHGSVFQCRSCSLLISLSLQHLLLMCSGP